jgi:predicted NodU family carbamoyl transferase
MSRQHSYVLGLNTYDHDVSACLLRDGAIAFAIAKERITREKQYVIQRQGRADCGDATRRRGVLPDHWHRSSGHARHADFEKWASRHHRVRWSASMATPRAWSCERAAGVNRPARRGRNAMSGRN